MDLLPFGAVTELSRWLFPQYSWCLCCRHGKPNNCKQWLNADGSLEKWKPKDAGQMSFVIFQLKAQTCMCLQHATFVFLDRFVRHLLPRQRLLLALPTFRCS